MPTLSFYETIEDVLKMSKNPEKSPHSSTKNPEFSGNKIAMMTMLLPLEGIVILPPEN